MKRYIIQLWAAAALICGGSGCMDALDTAPYDKIASSNMWASDELCDQGVAGAYAALRSWTPYNGGWTSGMYGWDSWGMSGQHQYGEAILQGSVTPGYYAFSDTWKKQYEGVHRANDAIAHLPSAPIDEAKKARLICEAKFLRALYYLRLNALFGGDGLGVPLYTEPVAPADCNQGQAGEAAVWAQIEKDLKDCTTEANFPDNDFTTGRATKGAAWALLGKAYLYQEKWADAADAFSKVAACGYALFTGGYKALFTVDNEHCSEMIFSIQNVSVPTGYGTMSQQYCGTRSALGATGGNGWGDYQVAPAVVDLYEKADGTAFNWEAVIPGYASMSPADREIFFLRDTLSGNLGKDSAALCKKVKAELAKASATAIAQYLPSGNEARIAAAYANRDPRLAANVITPYAIFNGYDGVDAPMDLVSRWPVSGGNAQPNSTQRNDLALNAPNFFYYWHRKFVYEGAGVDRANCPTDDPLIRYADVLLMWAEALVETNDLTGAKDKVKEVRDRVGMPTLDANFADQTTARSYVRDERRREFVNEGINFFDEMRWRTWKDTKFGGDADNGHTSTVYGANGNAGNYKWAGDYIYVWPVPSTEIQKNSNLTPTPGWKY